jgi:predicted DNA-binding transcriptional regulator AlpA
MKRALGGLLLFGINREQAAVAIGVSPTTFDQMVADGRMPQPRMPSKERYVWDVEELAEAFRRLPHRNGKLDGVSSSDNPWDRR